MRVAGAVRAVEHDPVACEGGHAAGASAAAVTCSHNKQNACWGQRCCHTLHTQQQGKHTLMLGRVGADMCVIEVVRTVHHCSCLTCISQSDMCMKLRLPQVYY
eukprot:scaffold85463_cov21-Tisochrysis_lutea.AAC.2